MTNTTVRGLIESDIIYEPMDGNHGELHPTVKDYVATGIPFIMAADIGSEGVNYDTCKYISETTAQTLRKGFAHDGDVLLTHKATIGRTALLRQLPTQYAVLTPQVTYYRVKNQEILNPIYLKYYFDSPAFQRIIKKRAGAGSTRAYIGITEQWDLPVSYPDIKTQNDIVDVLKSIDDTIANNTRICEGLDSLAKIVYDYWFTQFDFPNANGKPYRASGGTMEWNNQLKRKIPKDWKVAPLSTIISGINTGLNPRDNFVFGDGSIRYLTVKNLTTAGTIDFSSCDMIDEEARTIIHRRSDISVGDILFASIAPLGRCYLIQSPPEDWDINESVFSIRGNSKCITPEFLYMFFMSDTFIKGATSSSTGSIFKGIRINTLLDMVAVIPPKHITEAFSAQIKDMLALKAQKSEENMELTKLRDWLLPMLMNGQATVD